VPWLDVTPETKRHTHKSWDILNVHSKQNVIAQCNWREIKLRNWSNGERNLNLNHNSRYLYMYVHLYIAFILFKRLIECTKCTVTFCLLWTLSMSHDLCVWRFVSGVTSNQGTQRFIQGPYCVTLQICSFSRTSSLYSEWISSRKWFLPFVLIV
jgi:hypothetical protein